jgi:enoyl-[acyl-carrier protein] reductase III
VSALVVGGTGGIGSAVVRRYVAAGTPVVFTYLKAADRAARLEAACAAGDASSEAVQLDVRREDDLAAVLDRVAATDSGLEHIVLAMGSGVPRVSLSDFRRRHWAWSHDSNARATAEVFKLGVGHLEATRGSIVVLTSIGSQLALPNYAMVGPAKAALEATVRYAAWEGASHGVRVNAVAAGMIETGALTAYPEFEQRIVETAEQTPLGRLVDASEVAEAVHWMGSDEARMITGQVLLVDGGWSLRCGVT